MFVSFCAPLQLPFVSSCSRQFWATAPKCSNFKPPEPSDKGRKTPIWETDVCIWKHCYHYLLYSSDWVNVRTSGVCRFGNTGLSFCLYFSEAPPHSWRNRSDAPPTLQPAPNLRRVIGSSLPPIWSHFKGYERWVSLHNCQFPQFQIDINHVRHLHSNSLDVFPSPKFPSSAQLQ